MVCGNSNRVYDRARTCRRNQHHTRIMAESNTLLCIITFFPLYRMDSGCSSQMAASSVVRIRHTAHRKRNANHTGGWHEEEQRRKENAMRKAVTSRIRKFGKAVLYFWAYVRYGRCVGRKYRKIILHPTIHKNT
jgi:hypothetical protein